MLRNDQNFPSMPKTSTFKRKALIQIMKNVHSSQTILQYSYSYCFFFVFTIKRILHYSQLPYLLYINSRRKSLPGEDACAAGLLDLLLSELGEVLCLDNDGDVDLSVSEKLEVTEVDEVDDGGLAASVLGGLVDTLAGGVEDLVNVDGGAEAAVLQDVELAHTDLTEVTRMVLVHEDSVVVLTTGVTATTGMLAVLADTAVSHLDVTALLAGLVQTSGHGEI